MGQGWNSTFEVTGGVALVLYEGLGDGVVYQIWLFRKNARGDIIGDWGALGRTETVLTSVKKSFRCFGGFVDGGFSGFIAIYFVIGLALPRNLAGL